MKVDDKDPKAVSWFKQAPIYLLSGLSAEMVSGVIWTPMDVAKGRLQRGGDTHTTARGLLANVWKKEGYQGIFRVGISTKLLGRCSPGLPGLLGFHRRLWVRFIGSLLVRY